MELKFIEKNFAIGRDNPLVLAMTHLMTEVDKTIQEVLNEHYTVFKTMHPSLVILTIVNNVLLNLFLTSIPEDVIFTVKQKMAVDMIESIGKVFFESLEKIELSTSNPSATC